MPINADFSCALCLQVGLQKVYSTILVWTLDVPYVCGL
jgi:hypothetical protein